MTISEFAPAKINLALHVTGQRPDGYHILDSLVAFVSVGDRITVEPADTLSLHLTGPMAPDLTTAEDNLTLRAARTFDTEQGARITLDKHLPLASGIGGGSADAAATLRALSRLWCLPIPDPARLLALGADVPVCLASLPCRMSGIGDHLTPITLPNLSLVLVNPGVAVPTPTVFQALTQKTNAPLPTNLPTWADAKALAQFLHTTRNDLEPPALSLAPQIAETLAALAAQPHCLIARMSGSGATCFAIFPNDQAATTAAQSLTQTNPNWWVRPAHLHRPTFSV